MANRLHGSARTTPGIRAEFQRSKEKTSILAQRYGLSRTTVTKWRSRTTTADAPMGPTKPKSTVLSPAEEAVIVEFRRRTLLPPGRHDGLLTPEHSETDAFKPAPLPSRHGVSRAASQRDQNNWQRKVFADLHGLRAYRHCRAALGRRQTQHIPGH